MPFDPRKEAEAFVLGRTRFNFAPSELADLAALLERAAREGRADGERMGLRRAALIIHRHAGNAVIVTMQDERRALLCAAKAIDDVAGSLAPAPPEAPRGK